MDEKTENIVRSQLRRRLRGWERRQLLKDEEGCDSEDEGSSSAAAITTQAPAAPRSSNGIISTSPARVSAAPTSISSVSRSVSAAPTAVLIIKPSTTPFPTAPARSATARSSSVTGSTTKLPALSFTRPPSQPRVSKEAATSSSSAMETRIAIGAGVTAGAVVILGFLACFCLRRRYKRRSRLSQISEASSVHDEEQFLVRGAIGPTSTWQPWQPWSSNYSTRSRGAPSFVTNDDQNFVVANGMQPRSVQTHSTDRGGQGWYSMFSGSERIVSALTFSTGRRKSEAPPADNHFNEKSAPIMPRLAKRDSRASSIVSPISYNAPSAAQVPPQDHSTRFIESRFSNTERTVSSVSSSETMDMFFGRDSVRYPEAAYSRASSALEREYVTLPVGSQARASTVSSNGGWSLNSTLQPPPPIPNKSWKYSVGSVRSWLEEKRQSRQNVTPLP